MSFPRLTFLYLPLVLGLALLTGACAVPLAVTAGSYAADGGLMVASNKTATDHLASMVSKQDCALWRVFRGRKVCKEREGDKDPYAVDYNGPQRSVSEDGVVQYGPPLRPAPDAPAMSWDAAAYKAAPAEPAPAEPSRRQPNLRRRSPMQRPHRPLQPCRAAGRAQGQEVEGRAFG